jgi:nicotinamidase/pyrazinamidase
MTEEELASLLEFVLARRPDRVAQAALGTLTPELRSVAVELAEAMSSLAWSEAAEAPSAELRKRILATVAARKPRKALLVVDMINDHLTPGRPLEVPRAREIVPALQERLAAARKEGTPIVYVLDQHDPSDTDLDVWGYHAVAGTEGADVWPDLAPREGDHVVTKPSYSGFFQSELEKVLTELRIEIVELTGCSTEVQLMTTATDALQLGFAVHVPPALQAGVSEETEAAALGAVSLLVPYEPSRKARLARYAAAAAAAAAHA